MMSHKLNPDKSKNVVTFDVIKENTGLRLVKKQNITMFFCFVTK